MTWQEWREHIAETHTTAKERAIFTDWTAERLAWQDHIGDLQEALRLAQGPMPWQYDQPPATPAPPELQAMLDDVAQIAARDTARRERLRLPPWEGETP